MPMSCLLCLLTGGLFLRSLTWKPRIISQVWSDVTFLKMVEMDSLDPFPSGMLKD